MFSNKMYFLFSTFFVVVISLLFLTTEGAHAAPFISFPVTVTQPDGTKVNLFASGDEFYNWLQDAKGYTVIQDPDTGYYVYANLNNGVLVATKYIAGRVDPAAVGLRPYLNISPAQKEKIRQESLDQTKKAAGVTRNAPTSGTMTNLVIFIRFSGESEFSNPLSTYTNMLNSSTVGADSLKNYYQEASYGQLTINSALFPISGTSSVFSYQDSHTRSYFQPYNATTNPDGYSGGDNSSDRAMREQTLLHDAINYVNGLGEFPNGATIDADGDGYVDSMTFIVSGGPDGWNSLLWPHMWSMFEYSMTINDKKVGSYNFQLDSMLNTGVLAHEMFHVLGAPDLYHYTDNGIVPVGGWDLMEVDADPPEHMGCYMKYKYGHWISSIPQISVLGTYTLSPLTSLTNNCFEIASPNSLTEFFVVEYRDQTTSTFESSVPNTGMLVYRINSVAEGNAGGPPDEVYIYRPAGTTTVDGNVNLANFSSNAGRTAINDWTDPSSFLSDGSDGGLGICNVGASNATISFNLCSVTTYSISGYVLTSTGTGISGVKMSGIPKSTTTDANGFYSGRVVSGWSGTVTPVKLGYDFSPINLIYPTVTSDQQNQNYTGIYTPAQILLVDDDDNAPDVRSYYTNTLNALGKPYHIWDTNNSDNGPDAATLTNYNTVIWFTGAYYGAFTGPGSAGETALETWLNGGGCFLLSSQDYNYARGLPQFASNYLGVGSVIGDVGQSTVTGAGNVFSGLGPYTLSYPFTDYSDTISPDKTAEIAFNGDNGNAAVDKNGGMYRTAYLGFPFEAISSLTNRQQVMGAFLNWCPTFRRVYLPLIMR